MASPNVTLLPSACSLLGHSQPSISDPREMSCWKSSRFGSLRHTHSLKLARSCHFVTRWCFMKQPGTMRHCYHMDVLWFLICKAFSFHTVLVNMLWITPTWLHLISISESQEETLISHQIFLPLLKRPCQITLSQKLSLLEHSCSCQC